MKGILSSRLLKGSVHFAGLKRFSDRQQRMHKRLKKAFLKKKIVAFLKTKIESNHYPLEGPGRQSFSESKSLGLVSKEETHEDMNGDDESNRGESKSERRNSKEKDLNVQVIEGTVTTEKPLLPKEEETRKGPMIPAEWHAAVQSIVASSFDKLQPEGVWIEGSSAPIVVICGGKNAGKSTFARYLVNSLLNSYSKVGYLDTDVGQPELTPAGCLSLHMLDKPILGLTALEMRDPERCFFYGDLSPKSNPEMYLRSIVALYDYFREKHYNHTVEDQVTVSKETHIPLVINTHGWIQGVGLDVLVDILRYTVPTHVVQVLFQMSSKNLPIDRFWELNPNSICSTELLYINNVVEASNKLAEIKFNARELRELRVISYFQDCFKENLLDASGLSDVYIETAMAMVYHIPYQVPISTIKVMHLHYQVPSSETLYSLNATLVGLGVSSTSKKCGEGMVKVIPPLCVGVGIIRGVDVQKGVFYLITPLSLEKLQQVDIFLHGRVEIPIPLLKAPGYPSPYLCRNSISIEGTGSAVMGSGKKKFLRS